MLALSLTFAIYSQNKKCQKFDFVNAGQGQGLEKRDLRHSIVNVRFHIGDFLFLILATWEHTFMQKITHTHTHRYIYIHTYTERERERERERETEMMTLCTICKADLLKSVLYKRNQLLWRLFSIHSSQLLWNV